MAAWCGSVMAYMAARSSRISAASRCCTAATVLREWRVRRSTSSAWNGSRRKPSAPVMTAARRKCRSIRSCASRVVSRDISAIAIRNWCLSDKPTLEELLEVQEHFGLPTPALVEKDWYVVKALAAIAAVDTGDFRLVFGGGTALSRAYKLTKRMSEDVDLKIVTDKNPSRGALRNLRTAF